MGITVEELVTKYTFDIDSKALTALNKELNGTRDLLKGFSVIVGGAAAAIFGIAKTTANAGEDALKASQKFGISAQSYQEFMYAARGEADALRTSFLFLNKSVAEVAKGNKETQKEFAKLGIVNPQAYKSEDLIMRLADSFKRMPNDASRTAAAVGIFGKQGANLLPFLVQGSAEIKRLREEAKETGYVLTDEAVAASDEFNDSLDDLHNTLLGVRNTVGVELIKVLKPLMDQFREWLIVNRKILAQDLGEFFKGLGEFLKITWKAALGLSRAVMGLSKIFGGFTNVVKIAAFALGLFAATRVLHNIGLVSMFIYKAVTAMTLFGNAALIAQAKLMAIPILIGAAIVAVGLILEDIVAFFRGEDSITGLIVEAFGSGIEWAKNKLTEFMGWLQEKMTAVGQFIAERLANIFSPLTMGMGFLQRGLNAVLGVKGGTTVGSAPATSLAGQMSPTTAPSGVGSTAVMNSSPTINQVINVGQGSDPVEIGRQTQKGTTKSLDLQLREANRAFTPGGR